MSTHQFGQLGPGLASRFAGGPPQRSQPDTQRSAVAVARASRRRWLRAACLALCTWLASLSMPAAHAQDYAAAGQYFDAAQEAFQKGDFKRAAQQYQAAHAITKDPALLFSIGESWQRAGEAQKALDAYRAYLKEQPTASDRPEVEKRIQALQEALAPPTPAAPVPTQGGAAPTQGGAVPTQGGAVPTQGGTLPTQGGAVPTQGGAVPTQGGALPTQGEALPTRREPLPAQGGAAPAQGGKPTDEAKPEAAPVITPPAGEKPTAVRTAAWVGTAAAVALGTAGAIVGLGAQNRADELRRRTTLLVGSAPPQYDDNQAEAYNTLMSEGQSYNTVSIALLSAAGVATVASVVLFIVDFRLQAKRARGETKPSVAWLPTLGRRAPTSPLAALTKPQAAILAGSF